MDLYTRGNRGGGCIPELALHYYFGQSVLDSLQDPLRNKIDRRVYDFALSGPDAWNTLRFWRPPFRHAVNRRAYIMHTEKTGAFLTALAAEAAEDRLMFSYLAGFLCHYTLDAALHPYINASAGEYLHTAESRIYRGNHMAFERSLDRWILREYGNTKRHPMYRDMTGCARLPAEMQQGIDRIYHRVYGWNRAFRDINRAHRDFRRFIFLTEDPSGVLRILTAWSGNGAVRALPYSRRDYDHADILNLTRRRWHHPNDPSLISEQSIPELLEAACAGCAELIRQAAEGNTEGFGNRSCATGFPLGDPRENGPRSYSLLPRTNKEYKRNTADEV